MQWQDLEKNLKSTCEQFIMSITKLAVEPMLSFITKVGIVFELLSCYSFMRFLLSSMHKEYLLYNSSIPLKFMGCFDS